jgi:hypothetical protein
MQPYHNCLELFSRTQSYQERQGYGRQSPIMAAVMSTVVYVPMIPWLFVTSWIGKAIRRNTIAQPEKQITTDHFSIGRSPRQ